MRRQEAPSMPEGWYPHEPGDPFYELDWVFLHEHPEILRRHWEAAWRDGRVCLRRGSLVQARALEVRARMWARAHERRRRLA